MLDLILNCEEDIIMSSYDIHEISIPIRLLLRWNLSNRSIFLIIARLELIPTILRKIENIYKGKLKFQQYVLAFL